MSKRTRTIVTTRGRIRLRSVEVTNARGTLYMRSLELTATIGRACVIHDQLDLLPAPATQVPAPAVGTTTKRKRR